MSRDDAVKLLEPKLLALPAKIKTVLNIDTAAPFTEAMVVVPTSCWPMTPT